ncbi:MAG: NlpC/P60 family protein [Pseudomonas caspiana]
MLARFAPLVPLALVTLLVGCAANSPVSHQQQVQQQTARSVSAPNANVRSDRSVLQEELTTEAELARFSDNKPYQLPVLADSILERGKSLIGTRYRFGGTSTKSGFDCSGFIGYLFREEAGMSLPRSSREMINIDAPLVKRTDLEPGDLLFFSTAGRGRVSHAAIYLGDNQFIHSSSRRSGGVRVDSLDDVYWSKTFIEAKRALAMESPTAPAQTTAMTATTLKTPAVKKRKHK